METEAFSLGHVDAMIDFLDKHIAANTDTPAMLGALQQRLDSIDTAYRTDPAYAKFYSRMLEMQSLIYGRSNQDTKALRFMKEAVRQAGGVQALRSESIRQYIAGHHAKPAAGMHTHTQIAGRPVSMHHKQAVEPAQSVPEQQIQPASAVLEFAVSQPHMRRKSHRFNPFSRRMKIAFASMLLVFGLAGVALYFVPSASALPVMLVNYSEIQSAKKAYDNLTANYQTCSAQLEQERDSVDTYDSNAVSQYNQDTAKCQSILHQQEQAANKYDSLIAGE